MAHNGAGSVATRVQVGDELSVQVALAGGELHAVFACRPRTARRAGLNPRQARWPAHTPIDPRGLSETIPRLLAKAPEAWLALLEEPPAWDQRCRQVVAELVQALQAEIDRQVQAVLREQPPWE